MRSEGDVSGERIVECDHGIVFDEAVARGLTAQEIRERFPRLCGPCQKGCGYNGIAYASTTHYRSGDW